LYYCGRRRIGSAPPIYLGSPPDARQESQAAADPPLAENPFSSTSFYPGTGLGTAVWAALSPIRQIRTAECRGDFRSSRRVLRGCNFFTISAF